MVSHKTRNLVWQSCFDVFRLGLYYEARANRYQRRCISLRTALLIAALGCAASPFAPISHPAATIALAIATAVLALADYALDLAKKSAALRQINIDVRRLEADWNRLRIRMDDENADDAEIRAEDRRLKSRLMDATQRRGEKSFVADNRLNRWSRPLSGSGMPSRPSPYPPPPPRPAPKKQN